MRCVGLTMRNSLPSFEVCFSVLIAVAALQLTNLYKKGLENTHKSFQSGYAQALRDTLEYVHRPGASSVDSHVERYLTARLETLHHDNDHEDNEPRPTPTPQPIRRLPRHTTDAAAAARAAPSPTRPSRGESRAGAKSRSDEPKLSRRELLAAASDSDTPPSDADHARTRAERPRKRRRNLQRRRSDAPAEPSA